MPRVTITVPEGNPQPYRFALDRQVVTLGRGSENDIAIESGSVSVNHAEMHRIEGGYELRDAGSTNGIKVEGERHEIVQLRHGATLKIGDVSFDFQLSDEERDALARERPVMESPVIREPEESFMPPAADSWKRETGRSGGGGGLATILLFLILTAAAFFAGLAVRYQKETGASLLDAVMMKFEGM